jgi:phenylacetate-CoA ligase
MNIFDRRYELMPRDELEQLQLERLQALLVRLRRSVRRYREVLSSIRVKSMEDLRHLPTTTPEDLTEAFPYGMFALPLREVIRLHSTLGPQGKPIVIGHTRNDLALWGRLVARQLVAAGVTANDIIQIALGAPLQWGAAGYSLGAEVIEASIVAEDPLHVDYQLAMLENYRPTILVTTPLNAARIVSEMEQRRMDPQSLSLRTVLLTRPVDKETCAQFKSGLFADVKCNLGISEVLDPGFCVQCERGSFHANEDQFLIEVLDGELVVTALCREAMPLLRYRTRIGCELIKGKCSCGRTGMIFQPGARLDGRLRVAETSLYECQIAELLAKTVRKGIDFRFKACDDHIEIEVPVTSELFGDTMRTVERLAAAIVSEFQTRFGIEARVRCTAGRRT